MLAFRARAAPVFSLQVQDKPPGINMRSEEATPSTEASAVVPATDQQLLEEYRQGENDAAAAIYDRYGERLFALARRKTGIDLFQRLDPEDVVQSVFRTFFRRAADGSYELPDSDALWKLLVVITLNKIRSLADFHRAAKRDVRKTADIEIIPDLAAKQQIDAEDLLNWTVRELTESLPSEQQRIIQLRIQGFTVDEIATNCKRSKRTTERVLQNFRARLFAELETNGIQ